MYLYIYLYLCNSMLYVLVLKYMDIYFNMPLWKNILLDIHKTKLYNINMENILHFSKKIYHKNIQDGKSHYLFSSEGHVGHIAHKPYKAFNSMQVYKAGIELHQKLYGEYPLNVKVERSDL